MIRTTVRYKGIQYDLAVLLCGVSFSVSLLVSPVVSSYIVSSRSSRCIVSWGGAVLISSDLSFCYIVIALASSRLVRLVLRCVERDDLRFYPMSSSVLCRLAFSFASSRPRSPSLIFVRRRGHGRLVAWSMWGN